MANASFKMNAVEVFSENNQTVTAKNINVAANDLTTPSMCKAWVNFNGAFDASSLSNQFTVANSGIRAAYNVDYVIDHGQGDYEVHFENAMADANYCVVITGGRKSNAWGIPIFVNSGAYNAGSIRFLTENPTDNPNDTDIVNVAIFR
tara:strand:- start:1123 stop:1566 length:444 start_codon:yes stop_codon:yes gene_type:complete